MTTRAMDPPTGKYQVFFRTKKGGCGVTYEVAKAEFLSVFGNKRVELLVELPFKMRMEVSVSGLTAEEVSERAKYLGYTQGILSVHEEPYMGEELHARHTGRWVEGWIRIRDKKIRLTEIYRQNEDELMLSAPHRRVFLIEKDGEIREAKGHRYKRGLSPNDAKFIVNVAELRGDELILDPFAGIGGIVIECVKRNLKIVAVDVDPVLRPGLARVSHNRCAIADARRLPFRDGIFDAIITEPPFGNKYRQIVLDSIAELRRVVRRVGKIVLLIAEDMLEGVNDHMDGSDFHLASDFLLRRHGKLVSHVLVYSSQKSDT